MGRRVPHDHAADVSVVVTTPCDCYIISLMQSRALIGCRNALDMSHVACAELSVEQQDPTRQFRNIPFELKGKIPITGAYRHHA